MQKGLRKTKDTPVQNWWGVEKKVEAELTTLRDWLTVAGGIRKQGKGKFKIVQPSDEVAAQSSAARPIISQNPLQVLSSPVQKLG